MGGVDLALQDELIAVGVDLYRLEAGTRAEVLKLLERLQRELVAKLADPGLTEFSKARLQRFLAEASEVIDRYYLMTEGLMDTTLRGVAQVQAAATANAMSTTFQSRLTFGLPTESFLTRLVGNSIIQGAVSSDWWSKQSLDTAFKFAGEVRTGLALGETNEQIVARISGTRDTPGIMEISKRNARALVHTSIQQVANDARLETFRQNQDVIVTLRWFTALDGHVCPQCVARGDLRWKNDEEHTPVGHSVPWASPPIHFGDRCVLMPETKSLRDLGLDIDEPPPGARASSEGPVSAKTTIEDWLSRRTKAQQDEQLGEGRADLWRRGVITLQQLLSPEGNVLTLAQLQAKYVH